MSSRASALGRYLARRQRMVSLIALVVGVTGFTGLMIELDDRLSERYASQVQAGLDWRAVRGAQELSKVSELGAAVRDTALFNKALDAYAASSDVQAIAVQVGDKILTSHGTPAAMTPVFEAEPGTLVRGDGFVASWAPAVGSRDQVARIAVVVSTQRLDEAQAEQIQTLGIILSSGGAFLVLGALGIVLLTRRVVVHDHAPGPVEQPAADGPQLEDQLEERTQELDERTRSLRLILDHATQGFLAVELGGRLAGERSAVVDRWFGEPSAGATLADYLSRQDRKFSAQFAVGLESICAGVTSLESGLAELPRRLTAAGHTFDVKYAPLMRDDRPERILLIASDITAEVTREREEREERERRDLTALSQLITANREEYDQFFAEAAGLVASLEAPSDPEAEGRSLRTLKDSCAYYGLESFVALLQSIEASVAESEEPIPDEQRVAIANGWGRIVSSLAKHLA